MRYANLIFGILLSAAMASGCTSAARKQYKAMFTGTQPSAYTEAGVVPVNQEIINSLVDILHKEGYDHAGNTADIDDEEYFQSLKIALREDYDREFISASAQCNVVFQQALARVYTLPVWDQAAPLVQAGRAKDGCLASKGWRVGTQRMYDRIINLALQGIERKRTAAAAKPPKGENIAERVFENAWRSVVVVKSGDAQGSGVVIRPNVVATNCHVVDGGRVIVYKTGNRRALTDSSFAATIRKRDAQKDFCLLDVAGLWGIPASIRAYDTLKVGEDVYALGAPQGLDLSLSSGVISQLRKISIGRVIQTDAAISPGSSGGGLFDSENNLVGITTAKRVAEDVEGIGFAIPAELAAGL